MHVCVHLHAYVTFIGIPTLHTPHTQNKIEKKFTELIEIAIEVS